jgi:hypothetical protein
MAISLLSSLSELSTSCRELRAELASVRLSNDSDGLTTVMGPAIAAGRLKPVEIQMLVKDDAMLSKLLQETDEAQQKKIQGAVRLLMERYGQEAENRAYATFRSELDARITIPVERHATAAETLLGNAEVQIDEIQAAAARLTSSGSSTNATASKKIKDDYLRNTHCSSSRRTSSSRRPTIKRSPGCRTRYRLD